MSILKAEGLSKSYGDRKIISDISVRIEEGEMVSLLGVSGGGKTTLFNLLSGLETPDSGRVLLNGEDVTGKSGLVGYMQQSDLLLPFKSIADNVIIPLLLRGEKKKVALKKALPLFAEFGLEGLGSYYPAQLSGGMRQRAALMRSFLYSSEVLLMDEPFSALDAITRSSMQGWFRNIVREHGLSTFFITHDVNEALLLSDRIYILGGRPGQITFEFENSIPEGDSPELTQEFLENKKKVTGLINGE